MDEIGDKKDNEWRRLRKQLLALKARIARRENDNNVSGILKQRENYIISALIFTKKVSDRQVFSRILRDCKANLPVLK